MDLVIDANIVISALIGKGKTLDLIFSDRFKLFVPEYLFDEIEKHKEEILTKAKITESELQAFLSLISLQFNIIPKTDILPMVSKAESITPDPNDREYFALALKLHCAIWTNDKKLKSQEEIIIYNTTELIKLNEF